jgi:hypothetical protein
VPALILAAPARALEMVFESRSVFASYYGGGIEMHSSNGQFGEFHSTAVGTPFGGGFMRARQDSNITTSGFDLVSDVQDFFGPGGVAESNFQFVFRLLQPTSILLTGHSAFFQGPASLVSATSGAIPLFWGPEPYRNTLSFNQVLDAGLYTFTSNEWSRGDGIHTVFSLREDIIRDDPPKPMSDVPEGGSTAMMLTLGAMTLAGISHEVARRK